MLVGVGETENQALRMWQTENTAAAVKSSQLQSAAAGILCSAGVRNEREACQAAELISLSLKELKRPHPANCPAAHAQSRHRISPSKSVGNRQQHKQQQAHKLLFHKPRSKILLQFCSSSFPRKMCCRPTELLALPARAPPGLAWSLPLGDEMKKLICEVSFHL